MWTVNFQMFKLVLETAKEPEIKLPTSTGSSKSIRSVKKRGDPREKDQYTPTWGKDWDCLGNRKKLTLTNTPRDSRQNCCSLVSDFLQTHGLKHACPSLPARVCLSSYPLMLWCHPNTSFSVAPFRQNFSHKMNSCASKWNNQRRKRLLDIKICW